MKPVEECTREELIQALGRARNHQFAQLIVFALGVAAETHPEEVRNALAQVFDLQAVNDWFTRSAALAAEASRRAQDARELIAAVNADFAALEQRIAALEFVTESLDRRLTAQRGTMLRLANGS